MEETSLGFEKTLSSKEDLFPADTQASIPEITVKAI